MIISIIILAAIAIGCIVGITRALLKHKRGETEGSIIWAIFKGIFIGISIGTFVGAVLGYAAFLYLLHT